MLKIIFEFGAGPLDGKTLVGRLGENSDAERYYLLTNHGAIGQRIKVASDYAVETLASEQLKVEERHHFQQHFCVVTDRARKAAKCWCVPNTFPSRKTNDSYSLSWFS